MCRTVSQLRPGHGAKGGGKLPPVHAALKMQPVPLGRAPLTRRGTGCRRQMAELWPALLRS